MTSLLFWQKMNHDLIGEYWPFIVWIADKSRCIYQAPGRTSANPLWPPLWCSPACRRGCNSCTSETLEKYKRTIWSMKTFSKLLRINKNQPLSDNDTEIKECVYLSAGGAHFSRTWWRSRWGHQCLWSSHQLQTGPEKHQQNNEIPFILLHGGIEGLLSFWVPGLPS